jgi:hypothetical protein
MTASSKPVGGTEMLSKTRNRLIAIVASLSVAGLAVVPTASEAGPAIKLVGGGAKEKVTVCVYVPMYGQTVCETRTVNKYS